MPPQSNSDAQPGLQHQTVLRRAAVELLLTDLDGIYVDGTFGRGGHSREMLGRLSPRGRLIAFDRDPAAAAAAQTIADPRFHFECLRFSRMAVTLAEMGMARVHGILLDVGVSSPQLDDPARGFSLRAAGPLDMRMDPSQGQSAGQWLAGASIDDIKQVIRTYGEERFAASIAKAIVARRAAGPDGRRGGAGRTDWARATTADLAAVVASAVPRARGKDALQHPATRTFQALRIHINQELEELALALELSLRLLAAGGRLAVICFHSLEDRLVKRFIDAHSFPEKALARLPLRADQLPVPTLRPIAKRRPDADEIAANPRARSAVLRVAERTAEPLPEAA